MRLDRRPGQKEERYAQLLGGEVADAASSDDAADRPSRTTRSRSAWPHSRRKWPRFALRSPSSASER